MQFDRKVICRVGPLEINRQAGDQLKVAFDISKDISSRSNDATITLYNLKESNRNSIGREFTTIELEAGYIGEDNIGLLFSGEIRDVQHRREGMDILTEIQCGEGDKANRKAFTSKAFPTGTKLSDAVNEFQKDLEKQGVAKGEWLDVDQLPTLTRPLVVAGSTKRAMDMVLRSYGYYWSVHNGSTMIFPAKKSLTGMVYISPETGMIGDPTITDNGVKVDALLNPEIQPGHRVQIESQTLEMNAANGVYRVSSVNYSGDDRDGDFKVSIHGERFQGGEVDQGEK